MRQKKRRFDSLALLGFCIVILTWLLASWRIEVTNPKRASTILPSPWDLVTDSFPGMARFYGVGMFGQYGIDKSYPIAVVVLVYNSLVTIGRLLLGVTIGLASGIGLGLVLGWSRYFKWLFELPVLVVRAVPALALIPVFLIWFGGSEVGNIVYISFIVASMIVVNTIVAIGNVPTKYIDFARTQGATNRQIFQHVVLPAIVPELTGGIRVVLGVAWAVTLAAEYLAAQSGLGHIMIQSERFLFTGRMIIVIFLFMIYDAALNKSVVQLIRRITLWKPT